MCSFSQDLFYLTAHTHCTVFLYIAHFHTTTTHPPLFLWLEEMIGYSTWRNLVYQLAEQFPDCPTLQFAIKVAVHHLSLFCHCLHFSTCQVWDAYVIKCHLSASPSLLLPLPPPPPAPPSPSSCPSLPLLLPLPPPPPPQQCSQPSRHGRGTLGRGAHTFVCVCVPCSVSLCTPLPQVYQHYVDLDRVPPADFLRIPHFLGELDAPELVVM